MKGKQIEVARLWAAYFVAVQAAVKTRDTPRTSSATLVVDMEPPLEEGESSMKFLDWLTRSSAECFRNCALTPLALIRVESVRSALPSTSPMEERRLLPSLPPRKEALPLLLKRCQRRQFGMWSATVSPCVFWQTRMPRLETIQSTARSSNVIDAPLDTSLDDARRLCLAKRAEKGRRKGKREEDLHTRGMMVNLIRSVYSRGEADTVALVKSEINKSLGYRAKFWQL